MRALRNFISTSSLARDSDIDSVAIFAGKYYLTIVSMSFCVFGWLSTIYFAISAYIASFSAFDLRLERQSVSTELNS